VAYGALGVAVREQRPDESGQLPGTASRVLRAEWPVSECLDGHHIDDGEGSDGCEGPCDRRLGFFVPWLCCQERFEIGVGVELLDGDGTGASVVTFGHEMHAEVPTRVPSHLFAAFGDERACLLDSFRIDVECPHQLDRHGFVLSSCSRSLDVAAPVAIAGRVGTRDPIGVWETPEMGAGLVTNTTLDVGGGVDLEIVEAGTGATTLVVVPGFGSGISSYSPFVEQLAHEYHVIGFSPRGLGRSGWASPYAVGDWVDDLLGVVRRRAQRPVVAIGQRPLRLPIQGCQPLTRPSRRGMPVASS
jgi:hypothetical protein